MRRIKMPINMIVVTAIAVISNLSQITSLIFYLYDRHELSSSSKVVRPSPPPGLPLPVKHKPRRGNVSRKSIEVADAPSAQPHYSAQNPGEAIGIDKTVQSAKPVILGGQVPKPVDTGECPPQMPQSGSVTLVPNVPKAVPQQEFTAVENPGLPGACVQPSFTSSNEPQ